MVQKRNAGLPGSVRPPTIFSGSTFFSQPPQNQIRNQTQHDPYPRHSAPHAVVVITSRHSLFFVERIRNRFNLSGELSGGSAYRDFAIKVTIRVQVSTEGRCISSSLSKNGTKRLCRMAVSAGKRMCTCSYVKSFFPAHFARLDFRLHNFRS